MEKQPRNTVCDIQGRDITPVCPTQELNRNRHQIVAGIGRMQEIVGAWQNRAYPELIDNGVRPRYVRYAMEGMEFAEAVICGDGSAEALAEIENEAADVVIGIMGVVIAAGGDLAPAVGRKLEQMFAKYDPCQLEQLRAEGMSAEEAVAYRKSMWNGQK